MRYAVVDTRIFEVEAVSEADAIAQVEVEPDRVPACHTTTAERMLRPPAPATERPALWVVP